MVIAKNIFIVIERIASSIADWAEEHSDKYVNNSLTRSVEIKWFFLGELYLLIGIGAMVFYDFEFSNILQFVIVEFFFACSAIMLLVHMYKLIKATRIKYIYSSDYDVLQLISNYMFGTNAENTGVCTLYSTLQNDLGCNELDCIQILMDLEDKFGVTFDDVWINWPKITINDLAVLVDCQLRRNK